MSGIDVSYGRYRVTLTPAEVMVAAIVGVMRQTENLRDGRRDANAAPLNSGWQFHVEGALGECAVAKAMEIYWPGKGRLRHPDAGPLQVRTASGPTDRLILHPNDDDNHVFVHVVGCNGVYDIIGWCRGAEGKQAEYWADPKQGRPAFFVPQCMLHDIRTLQVEIHPSA